MTFHLTIKKTSSFKENRFLKFSFNFEDRALDVSVLKSPGFDLKLKKKRVIRKVKIKKI